jgi:acetolactate synthase-1/3 small subunit
MYDGETLDAGPRTITVQLTGTYDEIEDAIDAFRQFGIIEIARTGPTALARGDTPTTPGEKPAAEATYGVPATDGGEAAADADAGDGTDTAPDSGAETQAETTN